MASLAEALIAADAGIQMMGLVAEDAPVHPPLDWVEALPLDWVDALAPRAEATLAVALDARDVCEVDQAGLDKAAPACFPLPRTHSSRT